jgi:ADP-dependent phosphofructokinase/glucokinase
MTQKAVLGLGGTVDYELHWDANTVGSLVAEFGITEVDLVPPNGVDSERDLVVSLLCHLRDGTGGEHFVGSPLVVEQFAARFSYRVTLGGTPVRAAFVMSALGVSSTVHLVSIDDIVRRLLPADVDYLCSADHDSSDPHMIIQYPANAVIRVGDTEIRTVTANRLIYPSDQPNRDLVLSPDLPTALTTASLFLVSGFNSIQEREVLDARLAGTVSAISSLPDDAIVIYEDAGFHVPAFGLIARTAFSGHLDVYSLNEDELMTYSGRIVDLGDPDGVRSAILELHTRIDVPTVVLHSKYFALAHGPEAQQYRRALECGVGIAGSRYAHGDGITVVDVEQLWAEGPRSAVGVALAARLEATDAEFAVVPALDLQNIPYPTTIGLGDSFIGGLIAELVRQSSLA